MQRREREKSRDEKSVESVLNEKVSGADEVFITARSQEDMDRINDLNDERAALIKAQRMHQIQTTEGGVAHQDLEDVKQDILRERIDHAKSRAR
jgi:hypothetical protein